MIGETLRRATSTPRIPTILRGWRASRTGYPAGGELGDAAAFAVDPLASWVEATFGLIEVEDGASPVPSHGRSAVMVALPMLATVTGLEPGNATEPSARRSSSDTGSTIPAPTSLCSRSDSISSSRVAMPSTRRSLTRLTHITTQAQQLDPTDESRSGVLLPLAFCRECGQDYYVVQRAIEPRTPPTNHGR